MILVFLVLPPSGETLLFHVLWVVFFVILLPLWSFLKTTCRTNCMLSLHCCQYFEENRNMNQLCKTWIYFLCEAKVEVPAFLSLASRGRIPGIKNTQRSRDVSLCTEGGVGGNEARITEWVKQPNTPDPERRWLRQVFINCGKLNAAWCSCLSYSQSCSSGQKAQG